MERIQRNLPIIIGLLIPVLMIAVIAAVIYGGRAFSNVPPPTQNFIYALGDTVVGVSSYGYLARPANTCAGEYYRVASGTLKKIPIDPKDRDAYCKDALLDMKEPLFFLHDVKTNTSKKLTFEEAANFVIDDTPKAKDGYEYVQYVDRTDFGLLGMFGGGSYDYNARYLKNDSYYEKMNLEIPTTTYYMPDVFLGWVAQ